MIKWENWEMHCCGLPDTPEIDLNQSWGQIRLDRPTDNFLSQSRIYLLSLHSLRTSRRHSCFFVHSAESALNLVGRMQQPCHDLNPISPPPQRSTMFLGIEKFEDDLPSAAAKTSEGRNTASVRCTRVTVSSGTNFTDSLKSDFCIRLCNRRART